MTTPKKPPGKVADLNTKIPSRDTFRPDIGSHGERQVQDVQDTLRAPLPLPDPSPPPADTDKKR